MRISFGPFAFDRQSRLLWRDGNEIALPPRVLGVLELLIDRAGDVVARQDLLDAVWKDAFVTDTSLAEAISYLRQALGDDPQAPRYIQTVHRRGYRFLAVVSPAPNWGLTPDPPFAGASGARARSATLEDAKTAILWQLVPSLAALLCGALLGTIVWRTTRTPAPEPMVARFEIAPAAETTFDRGAPALAVSGDGRTIAWSGCEPSGACALYTRSVDRLEVVRLAGSEDASMPFFSPDGRWIGFFAAGKLKKIAAAGGSASILTDAPAPGGASWGPDGRIAFAGSRAGGISVVSEEGGAGITLTVPRADRGEVRHVYPAWLPRGGLLFTVLRTPEPDAPGELSAMAAAARDWKTLRGGVSRAALAAPGYLLLATGSDLQAATFDETALALTGGADSILTSVGGGRNVTGFAIGGGTLVAATSSPANGAARLAWADGADAATLARLTAIVISPDSRRAAGVIADGASDIWMADLESGTLTRMTFEGSNVSPAWSADGSRLYFASRTSGAFGLAMRRLDDRAVSPIRTASTGNVFPSSVAADGRIAVTIVGADGHTVVGLVSNTGGTIKVLAAGPFDEASPAFSPDGAWLAFESSESGRTEIVARDLRDGRRVPVSNGGGERPRWSADGRWIYFDAGQRLMRAAFDPAGSLRAPETVDTGHGRAVAVTPAGRVLVAASADGTDRALVVVQWLRELRQRLPLPVAVPR